MNNYKYKDSEEIKHGKEGYYNEIFPDYPFEFNFQNVNDYVSVIGDKIKYFVLNDKHAWLKSHIELSDFLKSFEEKDRHLLLEKMKFIENAPSIYKAFFEKELNIYKKTFIEAAAQLNPLFIAWQDIEWDSEDNKSLLEDEYWVNEHLVICKNILLIRKNYLIPVITECPSILENYENWMRQCGYEYDQYELMFEPITPFIAQKENTSSLTEKIPFKTEIEYIDNYYRIKNPKKLKTFLEKYEQIDKARKEFKAILSIPKENVQKLLENEV